MKDFLRTGILPCATNGSQVSIYHPGMRRGAIPDPYDIPTGFIAGDIDSGEYDAVEPRLQSYLQF